MSGKIKFINEFLDFLEDRSTPEIFLGENEEYIDNRYHELDKYYQQIRQRLNLPKATDRQGDLDFVDQMDDHIQHIIGIAVDAGYRQGFSEGIKLILSALLLDN